MLDVHVDGKKAGELFQSKLENHRYGFQYLTGCPKDHAVSLTMPVIPDQYDWDYKLHPIFDMNLPEGALAQQLRLAFSKAIQHFSDLDLLKIVGKSQIGRLRFTGKDEPLADIPLQNIDDLLLHDGADGLFEDLLARFAVHSGISGVQPKVMVRDEKSPRITHRGATHIVKAWNPLEFPELAANEFFCMRAAELAGLQVPSFQLSANGKFLVVERFDLAGENYLGFEDFCSLNAKNSSEKYDGSYENLTRRIKEFVSPTQIRPALDSFYKSFALSCAVKNGDAHLKNFGVLYDNSEADVRFSPAYDIVTTSVYLPKDTLALTLNGTKRWPNRKALLRFAKTHCDLTESRAKDLLGEVSEAVIFASNELKTHLAQHPSFQVIGTRMLQEWNKGLDHSLHDEHQKQMIEVDPLTETPLNPQEDGPSQ